MKTAVAVLALCFAACAPLQDAPPANPAAPGVLLSAEKVSTGVVRLTLDNGSRSAVGYNLCTSALERRDSAGWVRVETDDVCTMQLLTLNPGHDATFEKRLPANLPAGEYRYVAGVESPLGTSQVAVASNAFRVP